MSRVALITGGSSGIGRAVALRLAAEGYAVGITYHAGQARALAVAEEIKRTGAIAAVAQQNLENPEEAARGIEALLNELGHVDVFVNNAGVNHRGAFLETSLIEWLNVINVNLTGAFLSAQAVAKRMVSQATLGRIVNVTSILDREILDGGGAYCASKAGMRQLTRVMALELARHGIRVNGVAPGETATPMNFPTPVDAASVRRPVTPLGRPGYAEEVAAAVSFLLSDAASYVNGEVLLVDGGLALHGGPQALQVAIGNPPSAQSVGPIYPVRQRP